MKILNQWSTEREGNDSWLKYNLSIITEWDDDDVILQLKENHNGWAGNIKNSRSVTLNPHDVCDDMLKQICEYISDYSGYGEYESMLNTVADAIYNIGLEHGDLWFQMASMLRLRTEI